VGAIGDGVVAAPHFFVVRPKEAGRIVPEYLAWWLRQEPARRYLYLRSGQGVRVPVVRREVLESVLVPLPDLGTQRAIVSAAELCERERVLLEQLGEARQRLTGELCLRAVSAGRNG
jgi:restriction endonuclease S subunit